MGVLQQVHTYVLIAAALPVAYAAYRDLREFRIPNACPLALLALYPLHVWLAPAPVDIAMGATAAAVMFAVTFAFYVLDRFGGGDVKLLTALALWAGPALLADLVVYTTLAGGALAIVYISRAKLLAALTPDRSGDAAARERALAGRLPYGLAVAAGGLAVLGGLAV